MLNIDDEKLPPPSPAVAAQASSTQSWASWLWSRQPAARHHDRQQQRGDEQQRGADRRPRPPAEARHREGVGDPQDRADQVGHEGQQELLGHRHGDAGVGQVDDDDRPDHPDAEAEVLGEHRPDEVPPGDAVPGLLPERLVVRFPVVDPVATPGGSAGRDRPPARRPAADRWSFRWTWSRHPPCCRGVVMEVARLAARVEGWLRASTGGRGRRHRAHLNGCDLEVGDAADRVELVSRGEPVGDRPVVREEHGVLPQPLVRRPGDDDVPRPLVTWASRPSASPQAAAVAGWTRRPARG